LDKKLKISIIGSRGYPYVYSGYETLVKELSERLVSKGHSVRVYCHSSLFKNKPNFFNGIELIYTPSFETKFLSQISNSFFSFLHVCFSKTDIVLVVNSANGPFGILTKLFGKKTCINVDGLEWLRPKWKGLGSYYFKISSKLSTNLFDEIITDSNHMYLIYKKMFNKNSRVIAYGSTMIKTKSDDVLVKFKLETNNYYLIVGRLVPDNNSKLIIKAFLKSKSPKKLVIVGDVPYKDNYAEQVKKMASNNIVFTGYIKSQEKLSQIYKNCFCYIHGHEYGGTNPTMINALDLNCKIIALNTIFNREMLMNKKNLLFEKNLVSIKECINTIDLYKKSYIEDNYNLPKKYSWDHIANSYLKLFYKIIEKV
tara:strand:+ start:76 stop:1179 length:1104 start_codon:yes stop_codon:yes gene_type:complete